MRVKNTKLRTIYIPVEENGEKTRAQRQHIANNQFCTCAARFERASFSWCSDDALANARFYWFYDMNERIIAFIDIDRSSISDHFTFHKANCIYMNIDNKRNELHQIT